MSIVYDKDTKATLRSSFGPELDCNSGIKLLLIWNLCQRFNIRNETNDFKKSRKSRRTTPKKLTLSVSFCSESHLFYSNQPYIQFHCLVVLRNGTNMKPLLRWLFLSNSDLLLENVEKCSIDCD